MVGDIFWISNAISNAQISIWIYVVIKFMFNPSGNYKVNAYYYPPYIRTIKNVKMWDREGASEGRSDNKNVNLLGERALACRRKITSENRVFFFRRGQFSPSFLREERERGGKARAGINRAWKLRVRSIQLPIGMRRVFPDAPVRPSLMETGLISSLTSGQLIEPKALVDMLLGSASAVLNTLICIYIIFENLRLHKRFKKKN